MTTKLVSYQLSIHTSGIQMLLNIYIQNTAFTLYNRIFDVFPFLAMNLVCNWVLVLVRKSHPLATACHACKSKIKEVL